MQEQEHEHEQEQEHEHGQDPEDAEAEVEPEAAGEPLEVPRPTTGLLVNIDVDDLERAVRFYTDGLSLRVGRRFGTDSVELRGADAPIYLLHRPAGTAPFAGAKALRAYGRHWTPVHLDFAVADLDAAVLRAEAAGARREAPISQHAWGRMALLADPFGHGLCLIEFQGRGYDEIATSTPRAI